MGATRFLFLCTLIGCLNISFLAPTPTRGQAAVDHERVLLYINNRAYSVGTFLSWWANNGESKDNGTPPAVLPEEYIDWLLLADEAEKMELDQQPDFRHKIKVFLKARTIGTLKKEEVDDKLVITDDALWAFYQQYYAPRLFGVPFTFPSPDAATAAIKRLGKQPVEAMAEAFPEQRGPGRWMRPWKIRKLMPDPTVPLRPGAITRPLAAGDKVRFVVITATAAGSKEDFTTILPAIRKEFIDHEQQRLTAALLDRLMEKFAVRIDEDLLRTVSIYQEFSGDLNQKIFTSAKEDLTVGGFLILAGRDLQVRTPSSSVTEQQLKEKILRNILAANLTAWEALDRHYERHEPFRSVFHYYRRHRLVRALEQVVIEPEVTVTEDQVRQEYDRQRPSFTTAETLSYVTYTATAKEIRKTWLAVLAGKKFLTVVADRPGVNYYTKPIPQISPQLLTILQKLAVGECSKPLSTDDKEWIVFLLERQPSVTKPYDQVKEQLTQELHDRFFAAARQRYLTALREKSAIRVDRAGWRYVQENLR